MNVNDFHKLELYCEMFYNCSSKADSEAHNMLLQLSNDPAAITQLQALLANSQSINALIFSSSSITNIITNHWNRIPDQEKEDTRKFVLNYLYNQGPQLLNNSLPLLQNLVRLLCRIVKLGWLENILNQNINEQVGQFLEASTSHWIVGVTIYTILTEDMQPQGRLLSARFRRTAMSFREVALSDIFNLAIQTLQQISAEAMLFNEINDKRKLLRQVLRLCVNCLSFDFTGTMLDETNDDQPAVMIPHSWTVLREEKIIELLFNFYEQCWIISPQQPWTESAILCLQSLVLISAIRRSFFRGDEERKSHLNQLIEGSKNIMTKGIGLNHDECFHEFCRLVGKINGSHQLVELSETTGFQQWLDQVFHLTVKSLENWRRLPNSQHYLMSFWSNMVGPLFFLKETAPPNVLECINKVSIVFINSRIHMAQDLADNPDSDTFIDYENPLSTDMLKSEQLMVIASLICCNYANVFDHIVNLFNENQDAISKNQISLAAFQHKAAWLINLMGCLVLFLAGQVGVGGLTPAWLSDLRIILPRDELSHTITETRKRMCNEMSQLVLGLMEKTDALYNSMECIELAYLFFLDNFRQAYCTAVTTQRRKHELRSELMVDDESALTRDSNFFNIESSPEMFRIIAGKLVRNLQRRVDSEAVLKKTLQVLCNTTTGGIMTFPYILFEGVSSAQQMYNSPVIKEILANHRSSHIQFLLLPKFAKYRTSYYASLVNLVLLENNDAFVAFLDQFQSTFFKLSNAASQGNAVLGTRENRQLIIELARDFRGITSSTLAGSYAILYEWLVDKPKQSGASKFDVFTFAVSLWWEDSEVVLPILKFLEEFISDFRHRITFDSKSPNSIFLVKTVLTLFKVYGKSLLTKKDFEDNYHQKYKGIAWSLRILSSILTAKFVNLGTFDAYNDPILVEVIMIGLDLCLSIPVQDLLHYSKQLAPYYTFLEHSTAEFISYVMQLSPESLTQILQSLEDVCSYDSGIVSSCSSTIGRIVKYYLTNKDLQNEVGAAARARLSANTPSLKKLLNIIFQTIVAGDFIYSLSEALFYLIILFGVEFNIIQEQFIRQQTPEKKAKLKWHFENLVNDVTFKIDDSCKSKFSSNLYTFAGAIRSLT